MDTPGVKQVLEIAGGTGGAGGAGGLVHAFILDGRGGGKRAEWGDVHAWRSGEVGGGGVLWVHLDRTSPGAQRWLKEEGTDGGAGGVGGAGLDPLVARALLEGETRPRVVAIHAGLLVILRGVNPTPGAAPEDMVAIRMWVEPSRVISSRHRRFPASRDLRDRILAGRAPVDAGDFLAQFIAATVDRTAPVVDALADEVDALEERVLGAGASPSDLAVLRRELAAVRRRAIMLRRYLAPQRDALGRLVNEPAVWLTPSHRATIRESGDRVMRLVEDLDAARERAALAQEELAGRLAESMNQTMYVLSIVAALFLPLGFITGLLGVNVGGIPGTQGAWSFWVLCGLLAALIAAQVAWFRRKGWM